MNLQCVILFTYLTLLTTRILSFDWIKSNIPSSSSSSKINWKKNYNLCNLVVSWLYEILDNVYHSLLLSITTNKSISKTKICINYLGRLKNINIWKAFSVETKSRVKWCLLHQLTIGQKQPIKNIKVLLKKRVKTLKVSLKGQNIESTKSY